MTRFFVLLISTKLNKKEEILISHFIYNTTLELAIEHAYTILVTHRV